MIEIVDVTITAPDPEWLSNHCAMLIEQRLAASANIIPAAQSIYRWQGDIHRASEAYAIIHTRRSCVARIVELTKRDHPYEVPHVLTHSIPEANPGYADWVERNTES